jgi:hypothetical protein
VIGQVAERVRRFTSCLGIPARPASNLRGRHHPSDLQPSQRSELRPAHTPGTQPATRPAQVSARTDGALITATDFTRPGSASIGPGLIGRLPSVNFACYRLGHGSGGDVSHALRRSSLRGVVGQEPGLLEYGPCLFGMAAAGDDVIAGRGERLR